MARFIFTKQPKEQVNPLLCEVNYVRPRQGYRYSANDLVSR